MLSQNITSHLNNCYLVGDSIVLPNYQIPTTDFPKVKAALTGIGGTWKTNSQSRATKAIN